jgi:hypothetical protein
MNTKFTLTYESNVGSDYHTITTITKELVGDPTFDEVYESLGEMCMALGFSPDTVREFFCPEIAKEGEK